MIDEPQEKKEEILTENKDVWERAKEERRLEEKKESEKKISVEGEGAIKQQLKEEIEMMQLSPELQEEAVEKAKKIEFLGEREKLEHLMTLAELRGLAFAVKVAKNMNEPYILDVFHDILAKDGFYKKFLK